ncbi:hypothetical protein [Paenibacillus sp. Root52]|nr:hypothetical protein [Paenibacillus sp. Root52]
MERFYFALTTAVVSWVWFLGLAGAGRGMGRLDRTGRMSVMFNRISAVILVGVAGMMLWKLLQSL